MRYSDTFKLHFINAERKISKKTVAQLSNILLNFDNVVITHSHRYGSGIEYRLTNIQKWDSGRVVIELNRKDDDGNVSDNLK